MKENPILFTGENVRAILRDESPKTQTRRIPTYMNSLVDGHGVGKKAWNDFDFNFDEAYVDKYPDSNDNLGPYLHVPSKTRGMTHRLSCRVIAGDRLWVREAFYQHGEWIEDGLTETGQQKWGFQPTEHADGMDIRLADNPPEIVRPNSYRKKAWYSRPSIFMYRWACRIELDIKDVWIERVQEISEGDVEKEGINDLCCETILGEDWYSFDGKRTLRSGFATLWDSINKKRGHGWDKNDWCWVYEWPPYKGAKG